MTHARPDISGSVMVWILLGVAMFAALSYVVAQNMRSGGEQTLSEEVAKNRATQVLQYASSLRRATQTVLIDGYDALHLDFRSAILSGYDNTRCTESACRVFDAHGGGISYQKPAPDWFASGTQDWFFPAGVCVPGIGTSGANCHEDMQDNEDIIAFLPDIQRSLCVALNDSLGVENPSGAPPKETGNAWPDPLVKFTGTQTDGEILNQNGRMAGCFEGATGGTPSAGTYHFFQVLVPR